MAGVALKTSNSSYASGSAVAGRVAPITYTGSHLKEPGFFTRREINRRVGGGQSSSADSMSSKYFDSFKRDQKPKEKRADKAIGDLQPVLQAILGRMNRTDSHEVVEIINDDYSVLRSESDSRQILEANLRTQEFIERNAKVVQQRVQAASAKISWVDKLARQNLERMGRRATAIAEGWVDSISVPRSEGLSLAASAA